MKRIYHLLILLSMLGLMLTACRQQGTGSSAKSKTDTYATAKVEERIIPLYFSGVINPLRMVPVLSPVDGRLEQMNFNYGQRVTKGELLAEISSSQLQQDYRNAINSYLEKKNAYTNAKREYENTKQLYEAKVLSKDDYINAKNQYDNSILDFYQSKFALRKVLLDTNIEASTIEQLTIDDTETINDFLKRSFDHIKVISPADGVALFPTSASGGDSDSSGSSGKTLTVGQPVKRGDLLLTVGDLTGLSSMLKVSEININRISVGMAVKVTGEAFPNETLHGKVVSVSSQANPNASGTGGTSSFNVKVIIPEVTSQQSKLIHVGMTAKIEIDIKQKPTIMVPINAVICKNGQTMVTLVTGSQHFRKLHHRKDIPVKTGKTSANKIQILEGLKKGQEVVVYPQSSGVCL